MDLLVSGKILIRSDDKTDERYGRKPEDRPIREHLSKGIVNLDKPAGPTSHQVSSWVKDICKVKKTGHSGTLDPKVTGVLPIALDDATKIVQALLLSGKTYVGLMRLHKNVETDRLLKTTDEFKGQIYQKPPFRSAVKRELRTRRIYDITLIEKEERDVLFSVSCEAGTYIRKLCHDIGLVLGVGAHMQELRRIKAGPFDEKTIVTLHDLKDAYEFYNEDGDEEQLRRFVQPVEKGIEHLGKVWVKDGAIDAICHGAALNAPGICKLESGIKKNDVVALLSLKNELVAIGKTLHDSKEICDMKKGETVLLRRVVMKPGVYPRKWSGG